MDSIKITSVASGGDVNEAKSFTHYAYGIAVTVALYSYRYFTRRNIALGALNYAYDPDSHLKPKALSSSTLEKYPLMTLCDFMRLSYKSGSRTESSNSSSETSKKEFDCLICFDYIYESDKIPKPATAVSSRKVHEHSDRWCCLPRQTSDAPYLHILAVLLRNQDCERCVHEQQAYGIEYCVCPYR
ncbi:hypothetical protein AYI68_g2225 [Smittium mucronatum]|uniref:Uncharacterized protein n=1 Tax=Smittium mucronatum TaxID=133383 RepID=A0A1R0H3B2_9FUNG|nr:hypothetical protein AYI68_g2225 [Smittium mucronatum]